MEASCIPSFPTDGHCPWAAFPPSCVSDLGWTASGRLAAGESGTTRAGSAASLITGGGVGHTLVYPAGVGPCLRSDLMSEARA